MSHPVLVLFHNYRQLKNNSAEFRLLSKLYSVFYLRLYMSRQLAKIAAITNAICVPLLCLLNATSSSSCVLHYGIQILVYITNFPNIHF